MDDDADFLPYFWFPAPICKEDGKEVPLEEDSLEIVKEHLIRSMQTIRKRSSGSSDIFVSSTLSALVWCGCPGSTDSLISQRSIP